MELLQNEDVNRVSGGTIQAIGLGLIGAYIYDAAGGKEGIDKYLENSKEAASTSIDYWKRKLERFIREITE